MDRLERLLDLVHVLQTAAVPLPLSALKDRFPEDYGEGSDVAVRRKFERDKASLARIGIMLRYVEHDDEEHGAGYIVDTEASYLPTIGLDETERAVLATAAQAALADPGFPHRRSLRLALAKLGAEPDDEAHAAVQMSHGAPSDEEREPEAEGRVESLGEALTQRKRVKIVYRKPGAEKSTEREVDPYGLFLRRGAWYLVAYDHRSQEIRMFRLSRIEDATINTKKPGTPDFEVPSHFDLAAMMRTSPLHYQVHEPIAVKVRVDEEVAFLVERAWGGTPHEGGVFTIETTYLDYLVDQVIRLGPRAEILGPREARLAIATALQKVAAAHGLQIDEQGLDWGMGF